MDNIGQTDLIEFAARILERVGADRAEAESVARTLVWGDSAGRPNQGIWRLPAIVHRVETGGIATPCNPTVDEISASCAQVDGHNGFGYFLAEFAIDRAIGLAEATGVSFVGIRNSNHCGALGYYVQRAARQGCVSIALSNSFPRVVPHGGTTAALGTNPIAIGAPAVDGSDFVLDMSTSMQSASSIRQLAQTEGTLPTGIAIAADGKPTSEATEAVKGFLLPLGGPKGFGLAIAVEILAGILAGAAVSHEVRSIFEDGVAGGNGQSFITIKIDRLMSTEQYHSRFAELRRLVGLDQPGVRFPGERLAESLARAAANGICLDAATRASLVQLAERLNIEPPFAGGG